MELWIALVALRAMGLLAARYGCDSRSRLRSKEEHAAAAGMTLATLLFVPNLAWASECRSSPAGN
jgi:hypothetical protein